MLKQLRIRLALLCTLITGAVLLVMAVGALTVSERQLDERNAALFQSNVNAVVYKLQSDRIISNTWLAQTEAGDRLIISIDDNGQPFSFTGAWTPPTPRGVLIASAKEKARSEFGIDTAVSPLTSFQASYAFFEIRGEKNETYRAAVDMLTLHGGWQSVTVLRDMREESQAIARQRFFILALVAAGMGLLFVFGWWFAGRAIRPVEESQRRQVEFVAAASHELRSPLAVIRTSTSAMLVDPAQSEQFASTVERECTRMARLVDDLLLLAGLDAKTWSVRRETLDSDTLLLDAYERYAPVARESGYLLSLDLPQAPLPAVSGDAERLAQVLSILIDNALQHTPSGCRIVLRARADVGALRIEVEDNGQGIADAHKKDLFNRFYRIDKARSDKAHFGLGLSIAKELVALHRGTIGVRDTAGGGATFVVEIPV